jgi:hypothetical protein
MTVNNPFDPIDPFDSILSNRADPFDHTMIRVGQSYSFYSIDTHDDQPNKSTVVCRTGMTSISMDVNMETAITAPILARITMAHDKINTLKRIKYTAVWDVLGYGMYMFLEWLDSAKQHIDAHPDDVVVTRIWIHGVCMVGKALVGIKE